MLAHNALVWAVIAICGVCAEVDVQKFLGQILQDSKDLDCSNELLQLYCETRCGKNHACLYGKCYCLQSNDDGHKDLIQKTAPKTNKFLDFDDYTEMTPLMPANTYPARPALRHHIAHFCPNLEEARKCIRKCIELGKPAFCGKDHVCYCGHKYESPVDDEKIDVKAIYGQFKDLYNKYFGEMDYHHHDSHEYDYVH